LLKRFFNIDWILFGATLPLLGAGLITMNSFGTTSSYFDRQFIWIIVSIIIFFILSNIDFRFLHRTWVVTSLFAAGATLLIALSVFGYVAKGAQSWFDLGLFSLQPAEFVKIILIILLAKYFSRRHIEIAYIKHILVSGVYAFIMFVLVLAQPDFGSAIIIFFLWLGMVFVSGISKKHIALVGLVGAISFAALWGFAFQDYQKSRIKNFIHPLADIRGTGYNAYQSTIAVGSGQWLGKGVGHGTQSRLRYLPEYQTDFIFAAFAEEWGYVGVVLLFTFFIILIWRIVLIAMHGATNFEILFGLGVAVLFIVHILINIGMNIGVLPVTGTALPLLSYGGTHILTEFIALGILMGMRKYSRIAHKDTMQHEFLGPQ